MFFMQKGYLISFEGGEGAGKTVQSKKLAYKLIEMGYEVVLVREPGSVPISEQIRNVVLTTKNIGLVPTIEVLLFQAARAQLYDELVLPSLKAGKIVIMDRTRDSSVVYQGVVRGFGTKIIEQLNNVSTQTTYPDLTILLDVPENLGLERRAQTEEVNRLDMENKEFHKKVRLTYLALAKKNDHGRWYIVDASQPLDEVTENIWNILNTTILQARSVLSVN